MSPTLALPWERIGPAASWLAAPILVVFVTLQALVLIYAFHRYVTLWRWWRAARANRSRRSELAAEKAPARASWPFVTVQLPVFNERRVVERLIDAMAALRYPADRLEIQVLDDSTDATLALARAAARRHRSLGVDVRVLHRSARTGYKAGALAAGLGRAKGEILVVFDADFVPHPDFLERAVPHFDDPRVGMVQGRWEHLNRGSSLVTAAQGAILDSHFLLEHRARMACGLFFNFNGTAGAWRRTCIESAGGWQHDTLTEDLDLSYRAQLRGWRFVFDPAIETPGELPSRMEALKSQQHRWAKGSVQTARKLLPALWRSEWPARVKVEAFMHLTGNFVYPLMLVLGVLVLPTLFVPVPAFGAWLPWAEFGLIAFGVVPAILFLLAGQVARGAATPRMLRDSLLGLMLTAGLTANNTRAVWEGLGSRLGEWERTPKTGEVGVSRSPLTAAYAGSPRASGRLELILAAYFAVVAISAWSGGRPRAVPFALLLLVGLAAVGTRELREGRARVA